MLMNALRLFALVFTLCSSLWAAEVIKVGAVLPLSGDNAHLGRPLAHMLRYKFSNLPKDSRFEYKLLFEDDQLIPRKTLLSAKRLVEIDNVDVLLTFYTAPGKVVAPYAASKKKTHFMFCYDEHSADGTYNFNHVTPIAKEAQMWVEQAKARGYKKVAFMVHRNSGGGAALRALLPLQKKSGMQWEIIRFNQGEKDFRLSLAKLKIFDPDALFLYAFDPEFSIVLKQAHELGFDVPLTSISVLDQFLDKPELNGAWFVAHATPQPEFEQWYKETFSEDHIPVGAGVFSDMVDLVYAAYESASSQHKPDAQQIGSRLRMTKGFSGAFGPIRCTPSGVFTAEPTVRLIENGKQIVLSKEPLQK